MVDDLEFMPPRRAGRAAGDGELLQAAAAAAEEYVELLRQVLKKRETLRDL